MEARAKTFAFFADAGICKLQWLLLAFSLESGYSEVNMIPLLFLCLCCRIMFSLESGYSEVNMILQQRQRNSSGLST